jgi:thiol-disulfide isomerase/thioredoxin
MLRRHRGRVVLVDFWATWCEPCMELFPHAVELRRRFAGRGLTVVSLSMDDPERQAAVEEFLARQDAAVTEMEHFISRDGAGPQPFGDYQITGGALPHLKLYDRQGKLRKLFGGDGGPIDPRQVDRAVEGLLGESASATP